MEKRLEKSWSYLNIHDKGEDQPKGIFFDRDIDEWKPIEDVSVALTSVATNPVHTAKCKELENWKSFNVHEEIPGEGQSAINTRWVVTEKSSDGKKIVKARLVVRGFEENLETRSDSPMVCEGSLRLLLSVTSTMAWEAKTMDIKAAFLQGNEIKREVILKPPKEAGEFYAC